MPLDYLVSHSAQGNAHPQHAREICCLLFVNSEINIADKEPVKLC